MAFPDKGITSYGFDRPSLSEIIEDIRSDYTTAFGVGLSTASDSVAGHMIAISADRENEVWKLLEALYTSQTFSGAEGVYLNDMLRKGGVTRKGETYSTGQVLVGFEATTPAGTIIPATGTTITSSSGTTFTPDNDTTVINSVGAIRIKNSLLTQSTYIFTIRDINNSADYEYTYDFTAIAFNETTINAFYEGLKTFILEHTTEANSDLIYKDETTSDYLVGFNSDGEPIGISGSTKMTFNIPINETYTVVPATAIEVGYAPTASGEIQSISPQPTGYMSITNPSEFYPGSGIETDAEYRYRYALEPLSASKGTRDAIINAILDLDGTQAVKIYKNVTDDPETSPADPHSFMTVVYGGIASEIARTIYDTMPIDAATSGSYSTPIDTIDGATEIINYSPATLAKYVIRIRYKTKNNIPFSSVEKDDIRTVLEGQSGSFTIGDTVYRDQVLSSVSSVIALGRITNLSIEMKDYGADDTTYSTDDKVPEYSELPSFVVDDTVFLQDI